MTHSLQTGIVDCGSLIPTAICVVSWRVSPSWSWRPPPTTFICAAQRDLRGRITERILERVNQDTVNPVSRLPCFWAGEGKGSGSFGAPHWDSIERDFGPADAAMGLVPKQWSRYVELLTRHDYSNIDRLLSDCQTIIVDGFYQCWRRRCKVFHKMNRQIANVQPPPPQPPG